MFYDLCQGVLLEPPELMRTAYGIEPYGGIAARKAQSLRMRRIRYRKR